MDTILCDYDKFSEKVCDQLSHIDGEIDYKLCNVLQSKQNGNDIIHKTQNEIFIPRSVELRAHKKNIISLGNNSLFQKQLNKDLFEKNEAGKVLTEENANKLICDNGGLRSPKLETNHLHYSSHYHKLNCLHFLL